MTTFYSPKPMRGRVLDSDSAVLSGAIVRAYNNTNKEFSKESVTTDASGNFVMDMANFSTGYTTGDVIQFLVQETSTDKIEGQDVVDKISRDIIKQTKKYLQTQTNTKNKLFYGGLLANSREPYDDVNNIFKRRIEMSFKALNTGEL